MKAIIAAITFASIFTTTAFAGGDHQPKFGGQVRSTASFDLELVAKDKELTVYITDHTGKTEKTREATATAIVIGAKSKETVKLANDGKGVLKGTGSLAMTPETKVVVTVTSGKNTEQARFTPLKKEKADDHKGHKH